MLNLSGKDLHQFGIKGHEKGNFVLILGSKWCKSCKLLSPILEKFKDEKLISYQEIDISKNAKITQELNIHAVPALIFFKDGKLLNKDIAINDEIFLKKGILIGAFNEVILKEIIEQI